VARDLFADAFKANRGNVTKAAAMLGTTESIVGIRVKRYNMNPKTNP
jgi:Nif-specific regulatory protein